MRIALSTLDGGRIGIAAQATGIAQAALDLAAGYARERRAFGGTIGRFGQIQQKLADMQTEVEAARALTWRAARLKQDGLPHTVEGAQAKLFASGVARRSACSGARRFSSTTRLRSGEGRRGPCIRPTSSSATG